MKIINRNRKQQSKDNGRFIVGRQIRAPKVMCIDNYNKNHGIIDTALALNMADDAGMDLVQVSPGSGNNPPTCKVLDFGKYRYEMQKKDRATRKKQRENRTKIKEIKFRPSTGDNDLQIKAKQAKEFIDEGSKLKITITFRGREMSHQEVGTETLVRFMSMVPDAEIIDKPSMNGRNLVAIAARRQESASA